MNSNFNRVLLVDDEEHIRHSVEQTLELAGLSVQTFTDADSALRQIRGDWAGIVVSDIKMPGIDGLELMRRVQSVDPEIPVVLITGHGDIAMAIQAIRDGAYDFLEKPFRNDILLDIVDRALEKRALVVENRTLRKTLQQQSGEAFIGDNPTIRRLREQIAHTAQTDADVLIRGETGSGKEVVARALHAQSERAGGNFVAINCGAIPESMMESELFGHEAGSFTGAQKRHIGKFEYAHRGTVFLDEIESMPLSLGVKLLRTLQERTVERIGSNTPIPVDVRIIAACKSNLKELSDEGKFREDVYYRLNVMELHIPPLRDRIDDIPLLFHYFVDLASKRLNIDPPELASSLLSRLLTHSWPGNVRELRNAAERFVIHSQSPAFNFDFTHGEPEKIESTTIAFQVQVDNFEKHLLIHAAREHAGSAKAICEVLSLPRKTLYDKLSKHRLTLADYKTPQD